MNMCLEIKEEGKLLKSILHFLSLIKYTLNTVKYNPTYQTNHFNYHTNSFDTSYKRHHMMV